MRQKIKMNSIGLFGGTFDPIHTGHLITAQSVLELRNLSKIIFMPAYVSPLKVTYHSASSEDRANMVELVIKDNPRYDLSKYEIEKQNISYTIDTLNFLIKKYDNIELIIGYDNFLIFNKWRSSELILQLAKVIVLGRKINNINQKKLDERFIFVDSPMIEINSTEIRERVRNNLSIDFLVHPKIKNYIIEKKLYIGDR